MSEIKLLPLEIINEIAAGEVIEKPSAVVKELIENSIDSKADRINIKISDGGKSEIIVSDNGEGIKDEYIEKAIQRYATSKMRSISLTKISTLGFRGEALYSIANASKLSLTSRNRRMKEAREIQVLFGKIIKNTPAKGNYGTRVLVRDLFRNLPVRKKFLNTPRAEALAVKNLVKKIALGYPAITFSYSEDQKEKLLFTGDKKYKSESLRVGEVLGRDFLNSSLYIEKNFSEYSIKIFASIPTYNKANWQQSAVIINGRIVNDKGLLGVLKAAYAGLLSGNRYPVIVIYINLSPNTIDINVHPSKSEVRILNRVELNSSIIKMIRVALEKSGLRYSIKAEKTLLSKFSTLDEKPPRQFPFSMSDNYIKETKQYKTNNHSLEKEDSEKYMSKRLGVAKAQINNMFIVSQTDKSLIFVDQHAAHERIVLETLKKNYLNKSIQRQVLLIPEIINFEQDKEILIKSKSEIYNLGFIFDDYGDHSIVVREIPAILGKINVTALFQDLSAQIKKIGLINIADTNIEGILSSIACHNSVRAGKKLNIDEMNAVLRMMEETPNSGQCNHGRPTFVELKLKDVESLFGRI